MRLQIFSDLHVDVAPIKAPRIAADIDAVVIAGDICEGLADALTFARGLVPAHLPVVFVAGNHEHYRYHYEQGHAAARGVARRLDVTLLENETAVIAGVRFVGATLWTDYDFWGAEVREAAMRQAGGALSDHKLIRHGAADRHFGPEEARARHFESRDFITRALSAPHAGSTVVVTHHLPHEASIHRRFRASSLNPAFASNLGDLIERHRPALWIHGHTHGSVDTRVGATRILCNPHGYGAENPAFDPCFVVEV